MRQLPKHGWILAVVAAGVLGAPAAARESAAAAQESAAPSAPPPRAITLEEAVSLARVNDPHVIQAEGRIRTGEAAVRSAVASFVPSLTLSAGATRQLPSEGGRTRVENGQVITLPDEPWSSSIGLSADVQLFDGGRRLFELRQARAGVDAAEADVTAQRYEAALAVKQQYFNVVAARESASAARAQLDQAEQQLRSSAARVRARVATRSDSLRSEIQVRNARLAVLEAANDLELANAALTRATGSAEPVTAATDEALEPPGLALDDAAIRSLASEGPAVRRARADLVAARAAERGAWTDYLPSVHLSYSRGGSGSASSPVFTGDDLDYSGSLRFSLSFPLFHQLGREERIVQTDVAEANAQASLRDARLGALEGVSRWLGVHRSAEARVASQAATVVAAEEDLRVQEQRYAAGASTLLDVLTSQAQLNQARRDLIRARYDQRVAEAELEALVGQEL